MSEPEAIVAVLEQFRGSLARVGLEAGPLSPWLHACLHKAGFAAICIETRHVKASLAAMRNNRKDAHGIAQMMRLGWYCMVHVKSRESQELRMLLNNRKTLQKKTRDIENEIRGTLKAFGLKVGKVGAGRFEMRVLELLEGEARLGAMVRPMLKARAALITQFGKLHRLVLKEVRGDAVCRRFMTTHSVGPITALTTGVDDPERFRKSKNVGAHFGITPRKYSSGETDYSGHISKCGDAIVRSALYEAATVLLTRDKRPSALKAWGERIAQRSSPKRARVSCGIAWRPSGPCCIKPTNQSKATTNLSRVRVF